MFCGRVRIFLGEYSLVGGDFKVLGFGNDVKTWKAVGFNGF
jgi:hypothetical protein